MMNCEVPPRSPENLASATVGAREAVLPLVYLSLLFARRFRGFRILAGLTDMGEFSVLAGRSSCPFFAAQSSCSGRSSLACMSSMEVVVGGRNFRRVQNCTPRFKSSGCENASSSSVRSRGYGTQYLRDELKCNCVNSSSRCGDFVRGFGNDRWRLIGGSRWNGRDSGNRIDGNGRRNMAARAQDQQHESESSVNWMNRGSPYSVLGVSPDGTEEDIKVAFRNRIKEFHPDVYKGNEDADAITQRVIRAYEMLTNESVERIYRRKNMDPFEEPECEAEDVFVFEINCIGRGCPYPCVGRAPDIFKFAADTGCARAVSQRGPGQGEDYGVQLAVGQCPRNCIYWVTPMQREMLESLMERALEGTTYSSEVVTLEALITRANYENGRYRPPKQKRQPTSTELWVDWF